MAPQAAWGAMAHAAFVPETPETYRGTLGGRWRSLLRNRFFEPSQALWLALVGLLVLGVAHVVAVQAYQAMGATRYATFWPFNTFYPHLPTADRVVPALVAVAILAAGLAHARRHGFRLVPVLLVALGTLVAGNLVQGWQDGFVQNLADGTAHDGGQYYWDALEVRDPVGFVRDFEAIQPTLRIHSQTHPPGSVLLFWAGHHALGDVGLMSLAIAGVSALVSGLALYGILRREHGGDVPAYGTLLYFALPAVQVYYLASTDALIASLFLAALWFHLHPKASVGVPGAFLCLALAAFLTFLAGFMVVLLYLHALWTRRGLVRAVLVGTLLVGLGIAANVGLGYDYVNSFRIASHVENPEGFRLVAHPADYLLSRAMGLLEILVFVGPVVILVAMRGWRRLPRQRHGFHALLAAAAVLTGLMFFAGVFRTGETARAALFLQPFVLLAAVEGASDAGATFRERALLVGAVFLQAVAMQVFGEWFW